MSFDKNKNQRQMRLVACSNIEDKNIGFRIPLFNDIIHPTVFYVQNVDEITNTICDFYVADVNHDSIVNIPNGANVLSGDSQIFVFVTFDSRSIVGNLRDIEGELRLFVAQQGSNFPEIALQIAELIGSKSERFSAHAEMRSLIRQKAGSFASTVFHNSTATEMLWTILQERAPSTEIARKIIARRREASVLFSDEGQISFSIGKLAELNIPEVAIQAIEDEIRAGYRVATDHFGAESGRAKKIRSSAEVQLEEFPGSPLDRRLTFSTFLVGPSNKLAYSAFCRVAEGRPGDTPIFNPLYAHAGVGLGKTHLLQALAHAAHDNHRRALYLTAERYMSNFVASINAQTSIAFKEKLRGIDMLIIDDVQFLQGKAMQQEFCHTLNALIDAGRQVVVAADRPPGEIDTLDERVLSRFKGGLCVGIDLLDEALRVKFLIARIAAAHEAHPGFRVSPEVVSYVASAVMTNGRDLEGAVNRLLAHTTLTGEPLTVKTAETAIRDLVRSQEPKRVKIDDIQKLVASHYNISRADILSSRRTANVVRPRQIAMYLSKVLTLRSLPEIGRRFGGRDHTTTLHAIRKIEELVTKDKALAEVIELLKRILSEL